MAHRPDVQEILKWIRYLVKRDHVKRNGTLQRGAHRLERRKVLRPGTDDQGGIDQLLLESGHESGPRGVLLVQREGEPAIAH